MTDAHARFDRFEQASLHNVMCQVQGDAVTRDPPINPVPSPLALLFSSPLTSPSPSSAHTLTTCPTSFLSPVVMALSARLSNTFWPPSPKTHASDAAMGRPGFLPARVTPTFGRNISTPPPRVFFQQFHHVDFAHCPFQRYGGDKGALCKVQTYPCHSFGCSRCVSSHPTNLKCTDFGVFVFLQLAVYSCI